MSEDLFSGQTRSSAPPQYGAYQVRDTKSGKAIWIRIGSAWPHADGKGFQILLSSLPLDGRIALRLLAEETL
jgi:hypothetical protein